MNVVGYVRVSTEDQARDGVPTARGGTWAPTTILGILRRQPHLVNTEVA